MRRKRPRHNHNSKENRARDHSYVVFNFTPRFSTSVGHSLFEPTPPCSLSLSLCLTLSIASRRGIHSLFVFCLATPRSLSVPSDRVHSSAGQGTLLDPSPQSSQPQPNTAPSRPVTATVIARHGFDTIWQFPRESAYSTLDSWNRGILKPAPRASDR